MVKMPVIASTPGARRGPLQSLSCEGSRSFIRGSPSPSFPKSFEPLVENVACLGHVGCPLIVFQGGGRVSRKGRWAESGPALERACPGQAEPPLQPALSRFRGPGESRGGGARPAAQRPGAGRAARSRGRSAAATRLLAGQRAARFRAVHEAARDGEPQAAQTPSAPSRHRAERPAAARPDPASSHAFPLVEGRASFLNLSAL